jgi:predicted protein tyrosine phosphatase
MNGKGTGKQIETRLSAPVHLARALDALSLQIRIAEDWISPVDLLGFVEALEKQIRALAGLVVAYMEQHPAALTKANLETVRVLQLELADLWKNLDSLDVLREARTRTAIDFADEAEELRKLRSGELKPAPPSNSTKGAQP